MNKDDPALMMLFALIIPSLVLLSILLLRTNANLGD